jgi:uncharacterized membrane protein YgaE (UPF0421/DUF939 family)
MSIRYHYNLIYDDLHATLESFSWSSIQIKMAFKAALSCMTAIFIANYLRLDYPFWSGISTLVIMRPNVGAIFQRGWMRSAGCCIGCLLCLFFMGYIVQSPLLFSIFVFCSVFAGFYLGVQAKYGYFWSYMLINMTLIAMISIANPYDQFPLHVAFYRGSEILLGVLVAWFYNIILWPRYAGDELKNITILLIYKITLYIKEIISQYYRGEYETAKILKINKDINMILQKAQTLILSAKTEKRLISNDYQKYIKMIDGLKYRVVQLELSYHSFCKFGKSEFVFENRNTFNVVLEDLNKILEIDKPKRVKLLKAFERVKESLKEIEGKKDTELKEVVKKYPVSEIMLFYEFLYSVEAYCKDVIQNLINSSDLQNNPKLTNDEIKSFDSEYVIFRFGMKSISIYIPAVKNAVKGGLAVLFTFWICLWLHIPGGYTNMTIAIIAVFAPQLDSMSTKHKGILRFFGCLSGASIGLLFLMFNIDSGFILLLTIFIVTFFYCIIWSGKPGAAYLGLQGGIAFLLCVAGDYLPATSIDGVIERMTGIFLAVTMMWLFNQILWPENLVLKLKKKINDLRKSMEVYLKSNSFFSTEGRMAGKYSIALSTFKSNIESTLKVLELQEDLPSETIQQVANWAHYIQKISNKLTILDSFDKDIYEFILGIYPKYLKHMAFIINAAVNLKNNKDKERILLVLDKQSKNIKEFISSLKNTGLLRNKDIKFKKEFAVFTVMLKHLISDLKCFSEYKIDMDMLSEQ